MVGADQTRCEMNRLAKHVIHARHTHSKPVAQNLPWPPQTPKRVADCLEINLRDLLPLYCSSEIVRSQACLFDFSCKCAMRGRLFYSRCLLIVVWYDVVDFFCRIVLLPYPKPNVLNVYQGVDIIGSDRCILGAVCVLLCGTVEEP